MLCKITDVVLTLCTLQQISNICHCDQLMHGTVWGHTEMHVLPAETQEPEPDHYGLPNCFHENPKAVDQV